jgi:diguanylate cyclase (GGDEF) domain
MKNDDDLDIKNSTLLEIIKIQNEVVQAGIDLERIIYLVALRSQALVNADGAVIELKEQNEMVYRATAGLADGMLGLRINSDKSLSGLCVKQREPLICHDSENDPRVDIDSCRRVGLRSMIVVPLHYNDTAVGVLKVISKQPNAFTGADAAVLNLLSDIISAAIHMAVKFGKNELYIASTTDIMTGIKNRSYFYEILRTTFISSRETNAVFSVFIIDMDNLKKINDAYGHKHGDAALIELVSRIRGILRENDLFSRLGGDEFGIVINSIRNDAEAKSFMQRISESTDKIFIVDGTEIPLSASIGYSLYSKDIADIQDLISVADSRMYEHKKQRKMNRA